MNWIITFYKPILGWLLLSFVTAQLTTTIAQTTERPAAPVVTAPVNPPITGNPAVDETFAGIERASGWTDRALMLGMLVIVLLMCGYFLKMANDEIKRQRILSAEATKNFTDKIAELAKDTEDTARESIKQITLNTTAMSDYSRMSEANRQIAERVIRALDRVEAELTAAERSRRGYRDEHQDRSPPRRET